MTVVLSVTLLVAFKLITDGVYSTIVIATVGGYYTANVTQKATLKANKEKEST